MRITNEYFLTKKRWPPLSHLNRELHALHGEQVEAVEETLDGFLVVDFAHRDSDLVRLTVAGLWALDGNATVLEHFLLALRQCYDIYRQSDLSSNPDGVLISAVDLLPNVAEREREDALSAVRLLFEVEGIAAVADGDPVAGSSFGFDVGSSILAYRRVGIVPDYLEVRAQQRKDSQRP